MVVVFSGLRNTLFGKKKKFKSEGGDKIVKELQRQYRFRATLRTFGVLSMTVLYLPIVRMCLQSYDCIELDGVDGLNLNTTSTSSAPVDDTPLFKLSRRSCWRLWVLAYRC